MTNQVFQLANIIVMVATTHHKGIKALLREASEPSEEELAWILDTRRIDFKNGPSLDLQEALALIKEAGGWKGIQNAAIEVKEKEPLPWRLFVECVRWVGHGSRLNGTSHVQRIAQIFRVSNRTVSRWRGEVPVLIARLALMD